MSDWNNIFNLNIRTYVQIISAWLISEIEWEEIEVEKTLAKKNFVIKESALQKDYKKSGLYPIVSQSKDLISGYSNDKELLIDQDIPTVIFGDHTQVIKYIDFPFVIGADGVKILKPLDEYIPKFFYYLIKSIDLNSSKYARHYKVLRSQKIPYKNKSLDLQEEIVAFLDDLQVNALEDKTYFNYGIESKILELHRYILNINDVIHENQKQEKYISQLKQAILQEAIAGQLTAEWRTQNPMQKGNPDTDAIALLAKVKSEKQRLIADGKLKKEKSLAEIAIDEIPFSIPDSWVWVRLGEISSIVRGGSPRPAGDKKYYEGNIPFLKVADLTKVNTIFLNDYTYTIKEAGLNNTRFVEANTLMLTNSGATLGVPRICTFPTTFNDGIAAFLGLSDDFNKIFLYYFLKSKTKWFLAEAARGQGQPNLNTDIIGNTLLALPPLAEQKAIVEKVDRLMNIINQLEQQIKHRKQLAEDLMQTVLREAFE